jgi:hypothetical protein
MTATDEEREDLAHVIRETEANGPVFASTLADAILAAGFRRQSPITDEHVHDLGDLLILRFHHFLSDDAPRDAIDRIARAALEAARDAS